MNGNSETATASGLGRLWQGLSSGEQIATLIILTALVILLLYIWADRARADATGASRLVGWIGIRDLPPWQARILGLVFLAFAVLFFLALLTSFRVVGGVFLAGFSGTTPAQSFSIGALLVALLGAPFLIWRSVVAQKTVDVTEQGLITDRINAAVASLGEEKTRGTGDAVETVPNMEVRIGAIYALERIARENLDFHVQIMEILCAYIRENSPAANAEPLHMPPMPEDDVETPREAWERWKQGYEDESGAWHDGLLQALENLRTRIKPRTDIQTALEVLGRRTKAQRSREAGWPDPKQDGAFVFDNPYPDAPAYPESDSAEAYQAWARAFATFLSRSEDTRRAFSAYQGYRLDLRATNIQGYDLSSLHLKGARFEGAKMQGAKFLGAEMQGANLGGTQMQRAYLWNVQMQGAEFMGAQLQAALLGGGAALGPSFRSAEMQGADLRDVQMQGADLRDVQMQGANLKDVKISEETNLHAIALRAASLRDVDDATLSQLRDHWPDIFADGSVSVSEDDRPTHWPSFKMDRGKFITE